MLLELLARLLLVVGLATGGGLLFIVGRERLGTLRLDWWSRLRTVVPEFGMLGLVLATNNVARRFGPDVAWIIGMHLTDTIYQFEGEFVIWLQSLATPALTAYFSRMYVYGYVFLLVFPLIAYVALDDMRPLRTTVLAYAINVQ